jgi:hypothetical protein
MRDLDRDYAPFALAAAPILDPQDWAPALQLVPWAHLPQGHKPELYARFARQIEAAVLRDLVTHRL